jgi:hypothetical protein
MEDVVPVSLAGFSGSLDRGPMEGCTSDLVPASDRLALTNNSVCGTIATSNKIFT